MTTDGTRAGVKPTISEEEWMSVEVIKRCVDENERVLKAQFGDPVTDAHARALLNLSVAVLSLADDIAAINAQVAKVLQATRR